MKQQPSPFLKHLPSKQDTPVTPQTTYPSQIIPHHITKRPNGLKPLLSINTLIADVTRGKEFSEQDAV
jgi:hypothetical protein